MQSKVSSKVLQVGGFVQCTTSTNNILAVGTMARKLQLWDVRNWEMFHSTTFGLYPQSLHLTVDSKFLTVGGNKGELCIVMEIK